MKHSALTKGLAVLLAIISLSTLVSGLFGMRSAAKDRQKNEEELASLQKNIDDYRNLAALMMDGDDYDQLRAALERQKREYDRTTTRHRKELATFTATNGGLEMGAQSLAQAEAAMASGRTQLEAGKQQLRLQAAAFQTVYETAMAGKKQLEDSLPILDAAETMVASLRNLLESLRKIGDIMELPEESNEPEKEEEPGAPETESSDVNAMDENAPQQSEEDEELQNHSQAATPNDDKQENEPDEREEESSQDSGLSKENEIESSESESGDEEEEKTQGSALPEENETESSESESGGEEEEKTEESALSEENETESAEVESGNVEEYDSNEEDNSEKAAIDEEETTKDQETATTAEKAEQELLSEGEKPGSPLTGTDDNQESMRQSALEAYDAVLSTYGDALTVIDALQDREIPTSMMKEMLKREGITTSEEIKELADQAGLELTQDQEQTLEEMMTKESVVLFTSAQIAELKAALENAAGMPLDELMGKIQTERNAIEAGEGNYEINAEQFGTIRRAYTDNKEAILRMADVLEKELPVLEEALASGKAQITAAQDALKQVEDAKMAMDQGLNAMNAAEGSLYQGELMLAQGEAKLAETREKQLEKAEELETQKRLLNQTEKAMLQMSEEAELRKKLEEQEKGLRLAFLSSEQIRLRSDAGKDLLSAAESWYKELEEQTERHYQMRFNASGLLILSSFLALAAILSVLRAENSRLIPALASFFCILCSAGAVVLLLKLGRGISYSGLLVGVLACLELILLILESFRKQDSIAR